MRALVPVSFLLLVVLLATGPLVAGEGDLTSRRFDVGALVSPRPHAQGPVLGAASPHAFGPPRELPEPSCFLAGETLVELIRASVEPHSWDAVEGASIQWTGRWLEVRNHAIVLDQVDKLLADLAVEARRGLVLAVEVREAPAAAWPTTGAGARRLESGSLALSFGVTGALQDTRRVTFVADYDVEIAQGSNIANPTVTPADEGLVVEALAHPTADGRRALLELFVQRAAYGPSRFIETGVDEEYLPEPYRDRDRRSNGIVELPVYDHVQAHLTTLVDAGGAFSVPVLLGERLLEVKGRVRALSAPAGGLPLVSAAALGARPWPMAFGLPVEVDEFERAFLAPRVRFGVDEGEAALGDPEYLVEMIRSTVDPWYWNEEGSLEVLPNAGLFVRGRDDMRERVRAHLGEREADALRPIEIELRVFSVADVPEVGPGAAVAREGARLVAGGRLVTLSGRRASLMAGSTANVLVDYDVEVAQEARIADPIIGQAFDGLVANLTPRLAVDASAVALDLQLLRSRRRIATEPFQTGTRYLGPLDRVSVDRALVSAVLDVPSNGTHVVDLGRDPDDPARRIALEVAATLR